MSKVIVIFLVLISLTGCIETVHSKEKEHKYTIYCGDLMALYTDNYHRSHGVVVFKSKGKEYTCNNWTIKRN